MIRPPGQLKGPAPQHGNLIGVVIAERGSEIGWRRPPTDAPHRVKGRAQRDREASAAPRDNGTQPRTIPRVPSSPEKAKLLSVNAPTKGPSE